MYSTPADVEMRWPGKTLTTEETTLVNVRLADVERKILKRIPDLADKITAGTVDVDDVIQVEADAVLRLARNPYGLLSETDGNYSYLRDSSLASGQLEISPDEWEVLGWVRPTMTTLYPVFLSPEVVGGDPDVHPFLKGL